jgi:hypothetical protein
MVFHPGDRVLVNLAPFIGSPIRCPQVIPCRVIELSDDATLIQTEPPYRELELSVSPHWVEREPDKNAEELAASR